MLIPQTVHLSVLTQKTETISTNYNKANGGAEIPKEKE